jgi:4-aminobutyrate aminotransferase/(S)-3-amino-2-methylpropionate transaminase
VEGRHYVDFAGGIGVLNTGHRHPHVMDAVHRQLAAFTHTAFQVMPYASYVELAERLNDASPINGPTKTAFFTTGAEAVENAIKIARAATGRAGVIAFTGGFHGRTLYASALTGKVMPYKDRFGPLGCPVYHLPFPVEHHGVTVEDTLAALDYLLRATIGPKDIAAIIIEPVQGEGGFYVAPPALLQALREICDQHGIVLIADEVQSGFARTGTMFAIEQSGIEPDLITTAKSLAGGFPLSGVIGRAEVMDAVEPGGLGGTYGGNPVACAAALAVLDVIAEERLLDRAHVIGERIRQAVESVRASGDVPPLSPVRGLGAMVAFEVLDDEGAPDPVRTKLITSAAAAHGLILLSCGVYSNVIRILVPLTVTDAVLAEGLARMERALAEAARV